MNSEEIHTSKINSSRAEFTVRNLEPDSATILPIPCRSIKGTIPQWLCGSFIRNGPGITKIGNSKYNHLFDGLSVLHKFTVQNGKVTYQNRPLESDTYKKNMAAERIVVSEFGTVASTYTDPCETIFQRWKSFFSSLTNESTDNASVNVAYIGGNDKLYALSESNYLRQIDSETLETIGEKTNISIHTPLVTATPHPHKTEAGEVVNVGMSFNKANWGMEYTFIKVPFEENSSCYENARVVASIPSRSKLNPSYFHSFGITCDAHTAVLVEQPLCINLLKAPIVKLTRQPPVNVLKWIPNQKTLIHVVRLNDDFSNQSRSMSNGGNKRQTKVRYEASDLFLFHHINCYEDKEKRILIVDVAAYNDAQILTDAMTPEGSFDADKIYLRGLTPRRYILPLLSEKDVNEISVGTDLIEEADEERQGNSATAVVTVKTKEQVVIEVTPHLLHTEWLELPQINPKYNGRKYRYVYGLSGPPTLTNAPLAFQISKLDVLTGQKIDFFPSAKECRSLYLSEPIFVPRPKEEKPEVEDFEEKTDEDDGVLLTTALSKLNPNFVCLIILDAKNMREMAIANFQTIGEVTPTFHGLWTDLTK